MFFALVFPVLIILVFGAIFMGGGTSKITLHAQNLDEGSQGDAFLNALNSTTLFDIVEIPSNESIEQYINNNSLTVAIFIPKNFTFDIGEHLLFNEPGTVDIIIYGDPSKSTYGTVIGAAEAVAEGMNFRLIGKIPIINTVPININPGDDGETQFNYIDFYLPGIVGFTVMTNSLFAMTSTCAEYRQRNYYKLLATTNIKKWEWLVSKFIFYTLLLWLALVLTYFVGRAVFDMQAQLTPIAFVTIAVGAFTFTAMGMLVGIVVKDPEGASAIANAIGFPMMFLSGTFFPLEMMPDYLQIVAGVMPLTYLNNGLRDTMVYFNDGNALINLAIVFIIGIVFFILASKFMSWKEK